MKKENIQYVFYLFNGECSDDVQAIIQKEEKITEYLNIFIKK
jgi:hypothetical protein